jgi:hypothetical protein
MPIEPIVSLAGARTSVLTRCGFADQGTAAVRAVKRIDEFIREAMRELVHEADWVQMRKELRIELIEGQDRYDYPPEATTGQLLSITVEDEQERQHEITAGLRSYDLDGKPGDTSLTVKIGQPSRYRFIDGEIQLYPAPTARFINLVVFYIAKLPDLVDDNELLPFDGELIIRKATIKARRHFKQDVVPEELAEFERYLMRVKRQQNEARVFNVGGRQSHFLTRSKRVPRDQREIVGRNAPWSDDWNPW